MTYKFTDQTETVVHGIDDDGVSRKSMLATEVPVGETILPADPPPTPSVIDQISELEATVTPRRIREAVLGKDGGWLAKVDRQIDALRQKP